MKSIIQYINEKKDNELIKFLCNVRNGDGSSIRVTIDFKDSNWKSNSKNRFDVNTIKELLGKEYNYVMVIYNANKPIRKGVSTYKEKTIHNLFVLQDCVDENGNETVAYKDFGGNLPITAWFKSQEEIDKFNFRMSIKGYDEYPSYDDTDGFKEILNVMGNDDKLFKKRVNYDKRYISSRQRDFCDTYGVEVKRGMTRDEIASLIATKIVELKNAKLMTHKQERYIKSLDPNFDLSKIRGRGDAEEAISDLLMKQDEEFWKAVRKQ